MKTAKKIIRKSQAHKAAFTKIAGFKIGDSIKVLSRITGRKITATLTQVRSDGSFAYLKGSDGEMYYKSASKLKAM